MNPTIDQKKRFECMMNEFAEKHEPMCVRVYNHPDSKYRTNIVFSTPNQRKEYTVVWSEARSLTDAATAIFTDVSLEFGLVRVAPSGVDFVIKNVIFNDPATIVFWMDGTKTVVKCQEGDIFDPEKGLAMAISKKALGNKGNYCNQIKKWTEKYIPDVEPIYPKFDLNLYTDDLAKSFEKLIKDRIDRALGCEK